MNGELTVENGKLNTPGRSQLSTIHFQLIVGWSL